jgi:hypothetical protein
MDLNGWTGKTFTDPPLWVALKVSLGARKWRCEYCRLNFASFRGRRDVFTFKRWKKSQPHVQRFSVKPASPKTSRVHGTIGRTTGMLGVQSAAG